MGWVRMSGEGFRNETQLRLLGGNLLNATEQLNWYCVVRGKLILNICGMMNGAFCSRVKSHKRIQTGTSRFEYKNKPSTIENGYSLRFAVSYRNSCGLKLRLSLLNQ